MAINLSPNRRASITLTGDTEIIANLRKNADKIIAAAFDACNNGLVIIEKGMKKDCPVNTDPTDTDTIHLKDSIYIEPAKKYKKTVAGKVRVAKKTAMNVEFGTENMFPRVFMRTQLYKHTDEIRKDAKNIIKGGVGL